MKRKLWVARLVFRDGKKFTAQAIAETKEEAKAVLNKIILYYYPYNELRRQGVKEYRLFRAIVKDNKYL